MYSSNENARLGERTPSPTTFSRTSPGENARRTSALPLLWPGCLRLHLRLRATPRVRAHARVQLGGGDGARGVFRVLMSGQHGRGQGIVELRLFHQQRGLKQVHSAGGLLLENLKTPVPPTRTQALP